MLLLYPLTERTYNHGLKKKSDNFKMHYSYYVQKSSCSITIAVVMIELNSIVNSRKYIS